MGDRIFLQRCYLYCTSRHHRGGPGIHSMLSKLQQGRSIVDSIVLSRGHRLLAGPRPGCTCIASSSTDQIGLRCGDAITITTGMSLAVDQARATVWPPRLARHAGLRARLLGHPKGQGGHPSVRMRLKT